MSETIVFFGSGPVAAESLALLVKDFDVEAVITKPQPAHHKQAFPVLELTKCLDLPTYTADTKKAVDELFKNGQFKSKLAVVIDFGIIISQDVIDYFPFGIINSHFSLLPRWRGADPISFSILKGDHESGVSLMTIVKALDEGNLIAQQSIPLSDRESASELTKKLVKLSAGMLRDNLPTYLNGEIKPYPQPSNEATYSNKLTKEDGIINWHKTATEIDRQIRAYQIWPRSRAIISDKDVIITKAHPISGQGSPGKIYINKKLLGIYTSDGILVIDKLLPSGKKEMSASAFLAGHNITSSKF